jgi:prepilin-type N-terminal cleavage/methylation domain-containing protein
MNAENASNPKTKRAQDQGFTLLEVLFALAILGVGILAVSSMQISAINGNATSRGITESSGWVADNLERLGGLAYDDVNFDAGAHAPVIQGPCTLTWNVAQDVPLPNTKTITLTVVWINRGQPKTVTFNYYKADII